MKFVGVIKLETGWFSWIAGLVSGSTVRSGPPNASPSVFSPNLASLQNRLNDLNFWREFQDRKRGPGMHPMLLPRMPLDVVKGCRSTGLRKDDFQLHLEVSDIQRFQLLARDSSIETGRDLISGPGCIRCSRHSWPRALIKGYRTGPRNEEGSLHALRLAARLELQMRVSHCPKPPSPFSCACARARKCGYAMPHSNPSL